MVGYGGTCYSPNYNPPPSEDLEIWTWYDLDDVRDNLEGSHVLMNDLDSTTPGYDELAGPTANQGKGWDPIGYWIYPLGFSGPVFAGNFDGQGYEIRDLYINRPDEIYAGLFGIIDDGVVINDIGVVNVTVTGDQYVGGLAGAGGTFNNCYSIGSVAGNKEVGGLVGHIAHEPMEYCYSMSSVTGISLVGGLLGQNSGIVRNCYSTGSVTGTSDVGGLVGFQYHGNMTNSYSIGSVTGSHCVGGLVGRNVDSAVTGSFWDIEASGETDSGAGIGRTMAQMQSIDTFLGAGWNITAVPFDSANTTFIWNIVNNVTYPFLSWQS